MTRFGVLYCECCFILDNMENNKMAMTTAKSEAKKDANDKDKVEEIKPASGGSTPEGSGVIGLVRHSLAPDEVVGEDKFEAARKFMESKKEFEEKVASGELDAETIEENARKAASSKGDENRKTVAGANEDALKSGGQSAKATEKQEKAQVAKEEAEAEAKKTK